MMLLIAVGLLVLVLNRRGHLGPLTWAGREGVGCSRRQAALVGAGASAGQGGAQVAQQTQGTQQPQGTPQQVLAMRLADGQISADEYLERSSLLQDR